MEMYSRYHAQHLRPLPSPPPPPGRLLTPSRIPAPQVRVSPPQDPSHLSPYRSHQEPPVRNLRSPTPEPYREAQRAVSPQPYPPAPQRRPYVRIASPLPTMEAPEEATRGHMLLRLLMSLTMGGVALGIIAGAGYGLYRMTGGKSA